MKLVYRRLKLTEAERQRLCTWSEVLSFLESVSVSMSDDSIRERYYGESIKIVRVY